MFNRPYLTGLLCLVFLLGLGINAGLAQDEAVCTALQSTAFTQTGTMCADTGQGSMCYGHPSVAATFDAPTAPDFFSRPGNEAELSIVDQLTSWPADISVTPNTYGAALFNVQANLPAEVIGGMLGGKGVIYLVAGGVRVTDATPEDDLIEPLAQGVSVTTVAEADLRIAPVALDTDTTTNVIARIPAEAEVSADAITPDGEWVRVLIGGEPGWVSRAVIESSANLSELVVIGPDNFTPMQSVNIAPSASDTACTSLVSGMFVQGPDVFPVDVRVNGVDVRIASSALMIPHEDGTLEIYVISGLVTLFPNDPGLRVSIPPGFKVLINIIDFSFRGGENGVVYIIMTDDEMAWVNTFTTALPQSIVHYIPPLLRRILPSGVGQALILIEVQDRSDNVGIAAARRACADGEIPENICAMLGI